MEDLLNRFRQRLERTNSAALQMLLPDLSEEMANTTRQLREQFGSLTHGVRDERGIAVAVNTYLRGGKLASYRDTKYVCFGIESAYGPHQIRVIEHGELFPRLLSHVQEYTGEPRKFRRCYQGLLKGYLRYNGIQADHVIGSRNWYTLRGFLHEHMAGITRHTLVPEWVLALGRHQNLLEDNPCAPYAPALLDGDTSALEELKSRLSIDDETWVMQEILLAQVQAAINLRDDEQFKSHVSRLLRLLEPQRQLLQRGISLLLKRYAQCEVRPEHPGMRELALKEWGSPWLEKNKPLWHAQIDVQATDMVSLWLKRSSIRDFFELLQADGAADRERMEFWLQYAEAIDEIWLALGVSSRTSRSPDYVRIRKQMEGRWMELSGSSYQHDNAFLMKIGGYLFIEFGKQNNACHVFDAENMPFTLGDKSVSGAGDGLKNTSHSGHKGKMTHRHGWQWDFSSILRRYANAVPDAEREKEKQKVQAPPVMVQEPAKKCEIPGRESVLISDLQGGNATLQYSFLQQKCAELGIAIEDNRQKGGALWVRTDNSSNELTVYLVKQGFKFSSGKGWWHA